MGLIKKTWALAACVSWALAVAAPALAAPRGLYATNYVASGIS